MVIMISKTNFKTLWTRFLLTPSSVDSFARTQKKEERSEDSSLIPDSLEGWYEDDISSDEDVTDDINVDSEEIHTDDE